MSEHQPSPLSGDDPGADLAFLERAMQFQDGALSRVDAAAFAAELLADINKQRAFVELQVRSTMIHQLHQREAFQPVVKAGDRDGFVWTSRQVWRWTAAIAIAASLIMALWFRAGEQTAVAPSDAVPIEWPAAELKVRLAGASQAQFFWGIAPEAQSLLAMRRDYVLTSGLVELAFPLGASAIIEGPAVFRVLSADSLALDLGRCSVYAPDGAEGFRVETPVTRVVDRGTRFTVSVAETSETEVQVIEGTADVYRQPDGASKSTPIGGETAMPNEQRPLPFEARLNGREAKLFASAPSQAALPATFTPDLYRRQLPDRVISYEATLAPGGGAENLVGLTIQCDGQVKQYVVDDLIPIDLTWFKASDVATGAAVLNLIGGSSLSDRALNTGVINPGGQKEPLTTSPVRTLAEDSEQLGTPGFSVQFRSPVVNGLGPDVVFFEVQCAANPVSGDAFHVSPLEMRPGRRSLTVRNYDLTLTSPESLKAADLHPYKFAKPIASLAELETTECSRTLSKLPFKILAVAIDLSDLGFAADEQVEGLFFQDAQDDGDFVDPVYIAGLPNR
jgi:hypothetical protein